MRRFETKVARRRLLNDSSNLGRTRRELSESKELRTRTIRLALPHSRTTKKRVPERRAAAVIKLRRESTANVKAELMLAFRSNTMLSTKYKMHTKK